MQCAYTRLQISHQLNVKVAHVEDSPRSFSDHSKGLWQKFIYVFAATKHLLEVRCFGGKLFVC